jgi:LCP family protein required for cell wall assembly
MSGQFKKPFPDPEKKPEAAPSSFITEQDTVEEPAIRRPLSPFTPPGMMPPQGYVQGRHGQYGAPQPPRQAFPNAFGQPGQFSPHANAPGQVGAPSMSAPFAPPQTPRPPVGMPGAPFGGPGMGNAQTPNPAWRNQPGLLNEPQKKEALSASKGKGKQGKKKRRVPIWARVVIGLLTFLLLLGGGGFWYYQANVAPFLNNATGKTFVHPSDGNSSTDSSTNSSGGVLSGPRTNILLLGSDTDEKPIWGGHSFLAQTVIVVTIDPSSHEVGMLSIPRDYWLDIPGYGMDKLDTAFAHGGSLGQNNDMSGVTEVAKTLDQDFGIPIDAFGWVGLNGFIKIIDTVGGVDVNAMHPIVDDTYPDDVGTTGAAQNNYKRLYIPDGPQHMDGPTALEYVRSRHSTTDFDRSARQQQVLSALKLKLDNAGIIGQLPQIISDLSGYVYTSLHLNELLDLGNFARSLDPNKIEHLTLGGSLYTSPETIHTPYGDEDALKPNCATIVPKINEFLHITTGRCEIDASTSGSTDVAVAQPRPASTGPAASLTSLATASDGLSSADASSSSLASSVSDLFGLRDLLDLVSMVVLDSPQL